MTNSRKIEDLLPPVQDRCERFLHECTKSGIDLIITSTYRDFESQKTLWAQGRTMPGKIVTNARPGESYHNWRVAFDVVPVVGSKPVWDDMGLWQSIGAVGQACGLEWAGNWKRFREYPHFQYTGGLALADFQVGKTIKA
ncbi:MAG: M15 family metallopeptidase [Chlorobiaceae bacterium]|nr:M15 family metallopeptidase [Chlorobiaceae bacterium]